MDTNLRNLERLAATGDVDAAERLKREAARTSVELPASDDSPWQVLSNGKTAPQVGTGITLGAGSDCYPFSVVSVSKTGGIFTEPT